MEMEKKNVAIIILAIALIASGVGNIILVLQPEFEAPFVETIRFGNMYIAEDIDPQYSWDSASFDAGMMVWECLLKLNLSDPSMTAFPLLATDMGTYDVTGTELTFNLKENVKFHDGTDFNADAVVWSFNRLAYLMNITGTLPADCFYGMATIVDSLYLWGDGTPIINHVEAVSSHVVRFVLNRPHGVFRALLTFPASAILSPGSTPADDYINPASISQVPDTGALGYGVAIGTGPMKIETLETLEVRFSAFDNYHRARIGFDVLVHVKIVDGDTRNLAVLTGGVDIITDPFVAYYPTMRAEPEVTLLDTGTTNAITSYMGINNVYYNFTWRNAFSYCFNYSGVIDGIQEGYAIRMTSPVPPGIKWHNGTNDYPIYDLAQARSYMNQMGFGVGFTTEAQWEAAEFLVMNYTYNTGNLIREGVFDVARDSFDKIGVTVTDAGMSWEDFKDRLYDRRVVSAGYDSLNIWWVGWLPDYNDPENFINPLMSNTSASNTAQVNDHKLEMLMAAGIEETDEDMRRPIYMEIQRYVVEEIRNWMYGYHNMNFDCFDKDLKGWYGNSIAYNDFYGVYWDPAQWE